MIRTNMWSSCCVWLVTRKLIHADRRSLSYPHESAHAQSCTQIDTRGLVQEDLLMHVGTVALLVLDDLVLAMMVGGRNDGGAGPTGVPSIGVASTHPSSSLSRSIESGDDIVREKPTTAVVV